MSFEKLIEETNKFFSLHWQKELAGINPPAWSQPWKFVGSIENPELVGCYALFSEEKLLYVGVAESGLGNRTNAYTRVSPIQTSEQGRMYIPVAYWSEKNLTHMHTIGFSKDYWYLPAALEKYLIRHLSPPENVNGK